MFAIALLLLAGCPKPSNGEVVEPDRVDYTPTGFVDMTSFTPFEPALTVSDKRLSVELTVGRACDAQRQCAPTVRVRVGNPLPTSWYVRDGAPRSQPPPFGRMVVQIAQVRQSDDDLAIGGGSDLEILLPVQWFGVPSGRWECEGRAQLALEESFFGVSLADGYDITVEVEFPDSDRLMGPTLHIDPARYLCPGGEMRFSAPLDRADSRIRRNHEAY